MPNEVPERWTRAQLVDLVRAVLGEVREATGQFGMVHLYRGQPQAIEVEFRLGTRILGAYLVELPPKVAALLEDEAANPYNNLQATVRTTAVERALPATPKDELPPPRPWPSTPRPEGPA